MQIDVVASEIQYWHHLQPIVEALGTRIGTLYIAESLRAKFPNAVVGHPSQSQNVTLVASFQDSRSARRVGRRVVYLEHGSGQRYVTDPHPSYAGGPEHDGTVLFLTPREEVSKRWLDTYPSTPAIAIGSPRLDYLRTIDRSQARDTVALSFHAQVTLCQESSSAWSYYEYSLKEQIAKLKAEGLTVLGHGHPRLFGRIKHRWEQWGVEPVEDFEDVIRRSTAYAVDNSSTLYEAAALDIPVVALNAPWYRREISHGLRFWDKIPGVQCDNRDFLVDAIQFGTHPQWHGRRLKISKYVYGPNDGKATERAIQAIDNLLSGQYPTTDKTSEP